MCPVSSSPMRFQIAARAHDVQKVGHASQERVWQCREVIRRRTLLTMSTTSPSDLTDAEWVRVHRYLLPLSTRGRLRIHQLRCILDAIFYVVRSGCAWRYLPSNFPPWQTIFYHFRRLRLQGK